jgi:hypothetical protein
VTSYRIRSYIIAKDLILCSQLAEPRDHSLKSSRLRLKSTDRLLKNSLKSVGRKRRPGRQARLVQGYLERKRKQLLYTHCAEIQQILPHNKGVYALYKGNNLYYLGIAKHNLVGRVRNHLVDKHHHKWDNFSLYVCKSVKTIAALEKLFLRVAKPPGNGQIGRLKSPNLTDDLRRTLHAVTDEELMSRRYL